MIRFPLRALALLCTVCGLLAYLWQNESAAGSGTPHGAYASAAPFIARRATAPDAGLPVYVAIGASDSVGYGVPDPAAQGWVPRFAAVLPGHPKLVNLGVVGLTLHQAVLVDLPVALDAHPRIVTVWLAINDLMDGVPLPGYRADLHTLLRRLHAGTHARVLVGNLPDLALVPAAASRLGPDPSGTLAAWNAAIAGETRAADATLVDLYSRWRDLAAHPEYVGPDGLHPSVAGYARLAQIFAATP
jgi:lysophospholipase L1-like esterase